MRDVRTITCIVVVLLIGPVARGAEENVLANLRPGRPRLLLLDDELPRLRESIEKDETAKSWCAGLRRHADKLLDEPPVARVLVGKRMLGTSREAYQRIVTLAGLYRITGDKRYADRATKEMLAVAKFSDWHPEHFLDCAEMTAAVGIGYDWLYPVLSADDRATIRRAIIEFGLKAGLKVYGSPRGFHKSTNNWSQVCNGGLTIGALAVADPDTAAAVIIKAREALRPAMKAFDPDGGFIEGPSYWAYAMQYTALYLAALQTALGTDFDYLKTPGLLETGNFRMHAIGPLGRNFNYADASEAVRDAPAMFWLAKTFDRPVYAAHERMIASTKRTVNPFHLFWFNPAGGDDDIRRLPTAIQFEAVDVALMRDGWLDPSGAFVGFKGGTNGASHSHLDLGSFVYDCDGVRWAVDLGPDDYNLPAYFGKNRWDYYRLRTEGHNTLLINGKNQIAKARAPITGFVHDGNLNVAVADLSPAYEAPVTSVTRKMELLDRTLMATDSIASNEPVDVIWSLHTEADIKIADDGITAMLTQAGKRMRARIQFPNTGRFEITSANPPPPQKQQPNVKNLIVRQPGKVKDLRLMVTLIPQ